MAIKTSIKKVIMLPLDSETLTLSKVVHKANLGSTPQLLKPISNRIENNHEVPLKFIVFDFRQITGLDSSAINSFKKLNRQAKRDGFTIVLCNLNELLKERFNNEKLISPASKTIQVFADVDHGLEWYEEEIIKNNIQSVTFDKTVKLNSSVFFDIICEFSEFLEDQFIDRGTTIIDQGQDPCGLYFIEYGQVVVMLNQGDANQMRIKSMGSGTVVGEVSLYLGTKATATVITRNDCQIKFLSKANFDKLNQEHPSKASQLHVFIIMLLSGRMAKSNITMRALLD